MPTASEELLSETWQQRNEEKEGDPRRGQSRAPADGIDPGGQVSHRIERHRPRAEPAVAHPVNMDLGRAGRTSPPRSIAVGAFQKLGTRSRVRSGVPENHRDVSSGEDEHPNAPVFLDCPAIRVEIEAEARRSTVGYYDLLVVNPPTPRGEWQDRFAVIKRCLPETY